MRRIWSGAAGVLAEAVAELAGAGRWWGRRRVRGRAPGPVVVELRGGEPGDALALMLGLAENGGRLPVNHPGRFQDGAAGASCVAELLSDVADWYGIRGMCRRRRPIRFRRFRMTEQAYRAWSDPAGGCGATQVRALQRRCERAAYDERGGLLNELNRLRGHALQEDLRGAAALYTTGVVLAGLTLVPLVEWLVRHAWVHRPARTWLQRKLDAPGPQMMYLALCRVRDEPREIWDQWLTDAFLADVDAYYHLGRRLNRSRLPLLLMPRAEPGTAGGALLRHLRQDQTGVPVPRRSCPVVVAHTGAGPGEEIAVVEGVVSGARTGRTAFVLPGPEEEAEAGRPLNLSGGGPLAVGLSGAAVLGLVAAGLVAGPTVAGGLGCGQGMSLRPKLVEVDGQCVGVTDGASADAFLPGLAKVSRGIARENDRAERTGLYATVALMLPMTPATEPEKRQVANEVKGAYLAQYEANHSRRWGVLRPAIRLVLANPGRDYAHGEPVTDTLVAMSRDSGQNLRAVTGFNLSVDSTERALRTLTVEHGIPVVGGPLTADDLSNAPGGKRRERYPGMVRIVPTNSEQARALVRYDRGTSAGDSVLIVDDRPGDTYNASLADAFRQAVTIPTKNRVFTSPGPDEAGDTADQFAQMLPALCDMGARDVYFAGRPLHLRIFLGAMAQTPCARRNYKVITGSGASTVALQLDAKDWHDLDARDSRGRLKVVVQYAAPGHPDAWRHSGLTGAARSFYAPAGQEMARLERLNSELAEDMGGAVSWTDSRAMTSHDSVYTAVQEIKRAYRAGSDAVPSLTAVARQGANLYSVNGVAGATGMICLDNNGSPYDKAVAVVSLDPTSKDVHFDALTWPTGAPARNCEVLTPPT
ncbi:hypothetical protein ACGFX8_18195 [Streptomyces sp. NPDC048362]|uniref:hypothetical protein n=1 Tax=Streptomyces sp. NPDC048362 TaxID=3365539 RepID=UPI003712978B